MFVREKEGKLISYKLPDEEWITLQRRKEILDVVEMYPQTQFYRGDFLNEATWSTPDMDSYDTAKSPLLVVTLPLDVSKFLFPKLLKQNHTKEQAAHFPTFFRKIEGVLYLTVRTIVALPSRIYWWESALWEHIWKIPSDHVTGTAGKWKRLCLVANSRENDPIEGILSQRCVPRLVVESILADVISGDNDGFQRFLETEEQSHHSFYNVLGKPEDYKELQERFMRFYSNVLLKHKHLK